MCVFSIRYNTSEKIAHCLLNSLTEFHLKHQVNFFNLIFQVAFIVLIYILSDVLHIELMGGVDPPFALLTSIHVGLWIMVVLIDRYLHYYHRMLRTFGYLDFYTRTKDIRRLPLWILSLGELKLQFKSINYRVKTTTKTHLCWQPTHICVGLDQLIIFCN